VNLFVMFPWRFWEAIGPVANGILRNTPMVERVAMAARMGWRRLDLLDIASSIRSVWN
jgi:hypothetical protein